MVNNDDGSQKLGVKKFFEKTNRYESRKWEDEFTLSLVDKNTGLVKKKLSEIRVCPICESDSYRDLFVKQGFKHVGCTNCLTIYVSPSLRREDYNKLWYSTNSPYPFLNTVNSPDQRRFDEKRFLEYIKCINRLKNPGDLLDVGCGGGHFLEIAKKSGWRSKGIDIYKRAVDYACSKRLDVVHDDFINYEKKISTENYDLITLWEVIDILPNPRQVIEKAISMLKVGGLLGLSFRNAYSLAAMIMHEKCNIFLGSNHYQMMRFEAIINLLKSYNLNLEWSAGYISESEIIKNYLNFAEPYTGKHPKIPELEIFDEDFIHKNRLSYKFSMIFKKV